VERDGFREWPRVFSAEEMAELADALADVAGRTRAGVRGLMSDPVVASFATDERLLRCASEALRSFAHPFRATLLDKSPASNWLVTWHQDTALPMRARSEASGWRAWSMKADVLHAHAPAWALETVIALRVHLDDSRDDNGPLRVLPGTHASGVLDDDGIRRAVARVRPFECTIACGGVLAMRPLLVHASSKARSDAPRRVLHIEYASSLNLGPGLDLAVA
jgi:ectoine hydroxylase-related dioxygenase (phytanoyl-CoA dioxygenase family)